MYKCLLPTIAAVAAIVVPASAQIPRGATITGNGSADSGKCTVEVVVDGAAEVEINGTSGTLRNLSGQPPQWRRFECTSPMPANAANIRFQGVDGRGRQQLIRDPRNGGAAVVRIDDPSGGAEGYTFDLMWGGGNFTQERRHQQYGAPQPYGGAPQPYGGAPQPYGGAPQYGNAPQYRGYPQYGGPPVYGGGRFSADDAIRECRNDIRERAAQRFGTPYVSFENMRIDDNPGRRDWVLGTFTLRRDRRIHEFACSVDFSSGRVRWAQIDPVGGRFGEGSADRSYGAGESIQNCEREVRERVFQRGLGNIEFGRVSVDDRPGRNDWVIGSVRADRGYRSESFDFSCNVDLRTGDVLTVDLTRR